MFNLSHVNILRRVQSLKCKILKTRFLNKDYCYYHRIEKKKQKSEFEMGLFVYFCHFGIIFFQIRSVLGVGALILVGWYHSHPFWQPDPTINDINAQLDYQKTLKDRHYEPCVGLIVGNHHFNFFFFRT